MIRYPIDPIATALNIELGRPGRPDDDTTHGIPALAQALDCSETTAGAMRRDGLTRRQAERYAPRAGRHPAAFWPNWWRDDDIESEEADDDYYSDDPTLDELDELDDPQPADHATAA